MTRYARSGSQEGARRNWYGFMALLFFGTCLAYLDRQVLSLLKPTLQTFFRWSDGEFAHMGAAFSLATAVTIIMSGWLVDRFGVRRSYAWAMGLWSLVGIGHAFAATVQQFVLARILLAVGESVNGPAAVKATAQYLPVEQRSVALGLITASTNIGAIAAPLVIPPLAIVFGWQAGFIVTGLLGFIWLAFWIGGTRRLAPVVKTPARLPGTVNDWGALFRSRYTAAVIASRLVADWVFWIVLFWAPDIFSRVFHLSQGQLGLPVALTYGMAALGALAAGLLYPSLLHRGFGPNGARKLLLFGFALLALPLSAVLHVESAWIGALLLGLTMFAHNAFSTNLFGIIAESVPIERVARVMALGSVASNVSGFTMIEVAGWCLDQGYGYAPLLMLASVAYLAAALVIQLLLPKIAPERSIDASAAA